MSGSPGLCWFFKGLGFRVCWFFFQDFRWCMSAEKRVSKKAEHFKRFEPTPKATAVAPHSFCEGMSMEIPDAVWDKMLGKRVLPCSLNGPISTGFWLPPWLCRRSGDSAGYGYEGFFQFPELVTMWTMLRA